MRNSSTEQQDVKPITEGVTDTDKLLVLLLRKIGANQTEIAAALRVGQSTVSRRYGGAKVAPAKVHLCKKEPG